MPALDAGSAPIYNSIILFRIRAADPTEQRTFRFYVERVTAEKGHALNKAGEQERKKRAAPKFSPQRVGDTAEALVTSLLIRCGFDAAPTARNTKAVDIIALAGDGRAVTVDVKGAFSNRDFLISRLDIRANHFYVLVFFASFDEPTIPPEIYVVPSSEMKELMTKGDGKGNIRGAVLIRSRYRDAWSLLGSP